MVYPKFWSPPFCQWKTVASPSGFAQKIEQKPWDNRSKIQTKNSTPVDPKQFYISKQQRLRACLWSSARSWCWQTLVHLNWEQHESSYRVTLETTGRRYYENVMKQEQDTATTEINMNGETNEVGGQMVRNKWWEPSENRWQVSESRTPLGSKRGIFVKEMDRQQHPSNFSMV